MALEEPKAQQTEDATAEAERIVRALTATECFQRRYRICSMMRVNLSGEIDYTLFEEAALCAVNEQTLLSTIISDCKNGNAHSTHSPHFIQSERTTPMVNIEQTQASEAAAESIYKQEMNLPLDTTKSLFRMRLIPYQSGNSEQGLPQATKHLFLMVIDHVISDGKSVEQFLIRLFSLYDSLCHQPLSPEHYEGEAPQPERAQAPPITALGPEAFFSEEILSEAPEVEVARQQAIIDHERPDNIAPHFLSSNMTSSERPKIKTQFLKIPEQQLSALKRCANQAGVSLNSVLSASILLGIYRTTQRDSVKLPTKFAVDLRTLLEREGLASPEENRTFSCRASAYDGFYTLDQTTTVVELAKTVANDFEHAYSLQQLLKNLYIYSAKTKRERSNICTMISNIGLSGLKSQWRHFTIDQYIAHGLAITPFFGTSIVGFSKHTTLTFYYVTPWIDEKKIDLMHGHINDILGTFSRS